MSYILESPDTIRVINSGFTTLLPPIVEKNTVYQIHKIQLVNFGNKTVQVELYEGTTRRWRGQSTKNSSITIDFGNVGWRFRTPTSLRINLLGKANIDVNIMIHAKVTVSLPPGAP